MLTARPKREETSGPLDYAVLLSKHMRHTNEFIPICDKWIAGRKWYHQRFDGAPMFIFAVADAEMLKEKRKPVGTNPNIRVCFFSHGKADWYLDRADIRRGASALIKLAKQDPAVSTNLRAAWRADEKQFDRFFRQFSAVHLRKLSQDQLARLWNRYYQLAIRRLSSAAIIDHFALGTDRLIHEMLQEEVQKQIPGCNLENGAASQIFSTATAPVHQSFISRAEIDLMRIAAQRSQETLQNYQRRYFWIKNNYLTSRSISVQELRREIRRWRNNERDLAAEITKMRNTPKTNRLKKQRLLQQYALSPLLRTLLKISADFSAWQDERKRATYLNTYLGCTLLEEIGRRTGYTLEQLKYATGFEINDLICGNRPTAAELAARMAGSVFIAFDGEHYVITGDNVERLRSLMFGKRRKREINEFRGLTASLGRVQGTVKVIKSVDEIDKVAAGDILVAVMTRPDYVPAMRKASAIVTDEGGVTSHAAILSREFGIPCIISTRIATDVLKDGDFIEVNANYSTVTILERRS